MNKHKGAAALVLTAVLLATLFGGCGKYTSARQVELPEEVGALADAPVQTNSSETPGDMTMNVVPSPGNGVLELQTAVASGTSQESSENVTVDYSNTADGYIMAKYTGTNPKVKLQLTGPTAVTYTYNLSLDGSYDVFPLSEGSGGYKVSIYENISGTRYSLAFSTGFEAQLKDEFAPFIRPNKYVNFSKTGKTYEKALQLTKDAKSTTEIIQAIYKYVINNVTYDYKLAETVKSGYIPDVDAVLTSGKGICFDYAALMTAMLRSKGVPTKLVVGYTGTAYHAWINTYSKEGGWVLASIYFDGKQWKLMDPTFASSGKSSAEIMKYIGNGANYSAKYIY